MMKYAIAVTAAALSCEPEAAGRSILQKLDWKNTSLERFLPPADAGVPWLKLDTKNKQVEAELR